MDYISVRQAAEKWGVSERAVQAMIKNNRLEGATRLGREWLIPKNVERPEDKRKYNRQISKTDNK